MVYERNSYFINDRETIVKKHFDIWNRTLGESPLIIYIDGSGIDGRIRAIALINTIGEY